VQPHYSPETPALPLPAALAAELQHECARQGFSRAKSAAWQQGMVDPARGRQIWAYLAPYLPDNPRLLDLGCGYGAAAAGLLTQTNEVWALDLRFDRARFTRRRLPALRAAVAADACKLPFADATFHGVVFHDVIEHVSPDRQPIAVRELARLLPPGGVVSLRAPNRWQLRDEHNEAALLASWLPPRPRRLWCRLVSPSNFCQTWNPTWRHLKSMLDTAGLEILHGPRSWRQKLFKPTFSLCLRKRP
jgi:SAM-dependent methyltransferase